MSCNQTHRSKRQRADDAKLNAKRSRQEVIQPEEEGNQQEPEVPVGADNGRFHYDDQAR